MMYCEYCNGKIKNLEDEGCGYVYVFCNEECYKKSIKVEHPIRKDKCQQCKKLLSKTDSRNGTLLTIPVYNEDDFMHLNPKVIGWLCYECTEKLKQFTKDK